MAMLKQAQYRPYKVEEQVISFYSVTKGHLDSVALEDIGRFETELIADLRNNTTVLDEIVEKKALNDELEAKIDKAISEFKANFS